MGGHGNTKDRSARLRSRLETADKTYRTARAGYEADARDIFGLLREAWGARYDRGVVE